MTLLPKGLRWRLLLLSLLVVVPALLWLGWQLSEEFEASVERRVHRELENHMNQLLARVRPLPGGRLQVPGQLSDPRFNVPLSGLYWQVNDATGKVVLRSRSLWDSELRILPSMLRGGGVYEYILKGPRGENLFVLLRGVWIDVPAGTPATPRSAAAGTTEAGDTAARRQSATGAALRNKAPRAGGRAPSRSRSPADRTTTRRYIFSVAIDHKEVDIAVSEFNRQLYTGLVLLAVILAIMLVAQVVVGLHPLKHLQQQLEDVRHGRRRTLPGGSIRELDPLVQELNTLLAIHEKKVEEARARAANLAHGMKTPLAVLAAVARELRNRGQHDDAREIDEQIRQLSRHIEHELARSKIHGGRATRAPHTSAARPLTGIVRALRPMNDAVHWQMAVAEDATVPMEKGDFMELAGNLLENAAKWARTTVRVRLGRNEQGHPRLVVEDDGPGVPPQHYDTILRRGARLDETMHGNGLGLAIVRDILDSYGYQLRFFASELGGLGVEVTFAPARNPAAAHG